MSSTFTNNFRVSLAKQTQNLTDVAANSYLPEDRQVYIYVFIGGQTPWNSGTEVVPTPGVTDDNLNTLYKKGIFAKLVTFDNSSLIVPRVNWTSNTVYNTYEANTNFYVLNSKDQVFKCLSNVSTGIASTIEPELTLSTTALDEPYLETLDGYKWKYMYSISSVQKQKFMDSDWMPVAYNKFVRAAAQQSSIDIVTITNSGNNYTDGATQDIITIDGDGTGAILKANVVNGHVVDVIIQNRGQKYTSATLTFTDVSGGTGSGATAQVSIAPHDGHGYDPVYELGATSVMFNVEFDGADYLNFPSDNDFRQIVAIQNPYVYGTSTLATDTDYTLYTKIKTSPGVGVYNNDEKIYQGTTFADATFTGDVISFDSTNNYVYVNNVQGTLAENQAIKGLNSGTVRVATASIAPTLDLYSGKVLYISNKMPVNRDVDQTDRIRFIISF